MFKRLVPAALLALSMSMPVLAENPMNDLQIAHAAYTAGNLDIRYAHLALAISENPSVREFAELMLRDHAAVNTGAVALITKLKVTPQDNPLSQALVKGATEKRAAFIKLSGHEFDCAYSKNELAYHQLVNKTVEGNFIPNATVPELKSLLADALVTFKVHEGHAGHMVSGLKCS